MKLTTKVALSLSVVVLVTASCVEAKSVRIVVWDERQPKQQTMYKNFLGNHIANYLKKQKGFSVRSVGMNDPQQGLPDVLLDDCDVLIWWGHVRQGEISVETARRIVDRVKAGKLSFIVLHSAHWATPFIQTLRGRTRQSED
jgi:trehalose utilization protein